MNVYFSPWTHPHFESFHLLYDIPDPLLTDLTPLRNKENTSDNWLQCHAFLGATKNTFIARAPFDIHFAIHKDFGKINLGTRPEYFDLITLKPSTLTNSYTLSIYANWLFWSDEPLEMETMAPFNHGSRYGGYPVQGAFDINKWFRPIELAIQLYEGTEVVKIDKGDPVFYVKFKTNKTINLKRFYLNEALFTFTQDCLNYKRFDKGRSLNYLYSLFKGKGLDKAISKEIKANIIENQH